VYTGVLAGYASRGLADANRDDPGLQAHADAFMAAVHAAQGDEKKLPKVRTRLP
jgi:hypothetical protein